MKTSDKLAMRSSEIRTRLNEIAGMDTDAITDEVKQEADKLSAEYSANEVQYRSALLAEDEAMSNAEFNTETDGEAREKTAILGRASVKNFVQAAVNGNVVDGAEREVRDAFLGAHATTNVIPMEMLETRSTDSSSGAGFGSEMHRTPDIRLFNPPIADFIGLSFDVVEHGQPVYPIITAGPMGAITAENATVGTTEYTFSTVTLQPKRITSNFIVSREALAGLGTAYDRQMAVDMREGIRDRVDSFVVNGGTGLVGLSNLATITGTSGSYENWSKYPSVAVDGLTASRISDVRMLVGPETYRLAATYRRANTERPLNEYWENVSGGVMVTDQLSVQSQRQSMFLFGTRGNSPIHRGAMWNGIELIRDEVSLATKGQISVTALVLLDFHLGVRGVVKYSNSGIS